MSASLIQIWDMRMRVIFHAVTVAAVAPMTITAVNIVLTSFYCLTDLFRILHCFCFILHN
jgi:hypothetical protein